MRHYYLPAVCLLAASLFAQAQQKSKPPQLTYTVDSLALYTIAEDELERGREIILQQGYVSQIQPTADGELRISALRQHNSYLNGDKAAHIRSGLNTIPALLRATYRNGRFGSEGTATSEDFISLNSGLAQPFSFRASRVSSLVGGVQAKTVLAEEKTGVDLNTLLTTDPQAIGYRGDRYVRSRFAVVGTDLVVDYQAFQFVPFAARYVVQGEPTMRKIPLNPGSKFPVVYTRYPQQGRLSFYRIKEPALVTLDTLGKVLAQVRLADDLKLPEGMILHRRAEVLGKPATGVRTPGELAPVVATDWLFGPEKLRTQDPQFRIVRTDVDGKVIFDQSVTFSYPDFGYTQSYLISDERGCLVHVVLGKGLLKAQDAYAYLTPTSVAWQQIWDKKDPELVAINGGGNLVRVFEGMNRLVSQPDGRLLIVGQQGTHMDALVLGTTGLAERYYSINGHSHTDGTSAGAPLVQVLSLSDGKALLLVQESRNAQAAAFAPFTAVDMELQEGLSSLPKAAPGQKTLFFNATTGPINFPRVAASNQNMSDPVRGARVAIGLLKGKSLEEAVTGSGGGSGSTGPDGRVVKFRIPTEEEPFNYAPVLYLLNPQEGTATVRDLGRQGYSLPNQPAFYVNTDRNELYAPLRTLPKPTEWPRSAKYPRAVFLKVATVSW